MTPFDLVDAVGGRLVALWVIFGFCLVLGIFCVELVLGLEIVHVEEHVLWACAVRGRDVDVFVLDLIGLG